MAHGYSRILPRDTASFDQFRYRLSVCGRLILHRWPEILLSISAGGLAYVFLSPRH